MIDLTHDEQALRREIEKLDRRLQVAFAALCALRIIPAYRRFHEKTGWGDATALEGLFDSLWTDVIQGEAERLSPGGLVEECMNLVPSEDDGWDEATQPYAEDAAALAYACRARAGGDPQEAVWASRRIYEAVDHYVRSQSGLGPEVRDETVLSHPLVQAELSRQRRDLDELSALVTTSSHAQRLADLRSRSELDSATVFHSE